ncbi:MAG: GNAT family N-acetyltransferase, partial [Gemmatimonadales bacterium]
MDGDRYELAKMAVSPEAQGKGIGWLLGQAVLDRARELGATTVYLESNTVLEPAIALYRKLGFKRVTGAPSPYARCNIQMEYVVRGARSQKPEIGNRKSATLQRSRIKNHQ